MGGKALNARISSPSAPSHGQAPSGLSTVAGTEAELPTPPLPPQPPASETSLSDSSDSEDEVLSPGAPLTLQAEAVEEEDAVDSGPDEPPDAPRTPVRPFHLRGTSPTFSLRSHSIFGVSSPCSPTQTPSQQHQPLGCSMNKTLPLPAPGSFTGCPSGLELKLSLLTRLAA
uniref:Uncharacterized protein n=1 Tax=Monodelphis domestica TaxID=13616 RepID=A0A5F8H9P4_MONDO